VIKTPEQWFANTEKSHAKITGGKKAKTKERKTAFGFKFSPKSPDNSKNYQTP